MSTKYRTPSRSRDPLFERERARYEHPIASREYILETLRAAGIPLEEDALAKRLKIHRRQSEALSRRLAAMERDGQIIRNRKGAVLVAEKLDVVAGRIEGHPDGFGFLVTDTGNEDLYMGHREMRKVLHGDRVLARPVGYDRRGRREGMIVEIVERVHSTLVGRLHRERDIFMVTPADRRISHGILVARKDAKGAEPDQVVVVELLSQPAVDPERDEYTPPIGRVSEVLGNATDPGMEIEIALRKHDLPFEFSAKAKSQAARLAPEVRPSDYQDRPDLRDLALATIDGETAKDFDDAVYCERQGKGYRLVVAIADVSHYVHDGDPLDQDARERGNSVYFPRRVIPMLPEKLSNGLCSLNPHVDRLCVACDMSISATGAIRRYRFYPAVMRSRERLTYTRVATALADPQGKEAVALGELLEPIERLYELYEVLARARSKRGAIDFETVETQFVFDRQGRLVRIDPVERNDAHRLIEECMLAANVCASEFLQDKEHPALYRVHEGPTPEKLQALRDFLKSFGLQLGGGDKPRAIDYARLLESVKHRPDVQLLQTVMLRSLQQAVYSPENVGHFGLAYEAYTHFTSPIRRYPDLLVHRAIKAVLEGGRYTPGKWNELGIQCSQTERRADEATREVEAWLKAYYMKDRVGEEFPGVISAVTGFGIFVALADLYVEGLVHVSELGSDYFHFDAARHELLGERTRQRYRLSDRVRVRVVRVDLETARMDFVLA
ncbi:MAG: ribonuclease R [Betaproteobacteria bacterium RIFCSPLOWO2_12_FULL_66_14]|nr:MAG: ribonuclease R [Betaproteobacteria bacterium RIFCSPLOWO2_12_FULL_66_14]